MDLGLMLASTIGSPDDRVELALSAERAGFDAVFMGESAGSDVFVNLAPLARASSRIRLGIGIANVFSRSPSLLAMSASTLDHLSDGRVVLCLGASTEPLIEGLHGLPFDAPAARIREYVQIIREVWSGEHVEFDGNFYSPSGGRTTLPPDGEDPPLGVAALGPRNRATTGEMADVWLPHLVPRSRFRKVAATVADAARDAGRTAADVETYAYLPTSVDDDADAARRAIRGHVATYVGSAPAYRDGLGRAGYESVVEDVHAAWQSGHRDEAISLVSDEIVDDVGIAGPPDACRRAFRDWSEVGLDMGIVHFPPNATTDDVAGTIDAFADFEGR